MLHIVLSQLIVFIFMGLSIIILSWLFPANRKSQKKQDKKV